MPLAERSLALRNESPNAACEIDLCVALQNAKQRRSKRHLRQKADEERRRSKGDRYTRHADNKMGYSCKKVNHTGGSGDAGAAARLG